jgi:60 kDa SS-A/Ro ribonucleoprotein
VDPLTSVATRQTPQTEAADPRQVPDAAGGYAFKLGDDARIHRFLTLGTAGGTYYASERDLTEANADIVLDAARTRGEWLTDRIVEVSTAGRAPRQNPAIFALAAVAGLADESGRKAAFAALPDVCRTGTHLFLFARYVEQFRGWGRGLRTAVANWYLNRPAEDVAYQAVKYRQREGWSHRDLLRLAHPDTDEDARKALFDWIARHDVDLDAAPASSARSSVRRSPPASPSGSRWSQSSRCPGDASRRRTDRAGSVARTGGEGSPADRARPAAAPPHPTGCHRR